MPGDWYKKVKSGISTGKFKKMGRGKSANKGKVFRLIMGKFKKGALHLRGAGGKQGKPVKNKRQALAIAYNTARRMGFSEVSPLLRFLLDRRRRVS